MKQYIDSGKARIVTAIQAIGANLDAEILSLPGGSVIAVLLCLYVTATRRRNV